MTRCLSWRLLLAVVLVGALGAVVAMVSVTWGAQAEPLDRSAVDRFVAGQMGKHRIPGVVLAVFENGEVTYTKGYGTAGRGQPMTPDTPMIIGSTTKSFTAVAILQLVERSLVDLDASVRTYLPWFRVADSVASASVTVRHLLNHTSGLSELGYNRVLSPNTTLEQGVRDLRFARLTAPVGTKFQYFNPNYATLALIIETVSGQSYGDYVTEHIFAPLGMTHSYVGRDDAPRAGLAQGHSKLFGFPVARNPIFRAYMVGANYIVSTAGDLSRLLIAIDNGGLYRGARILSPASVALMTSPPVQALNSPYGMGWVVGSHRGERTGGHGGADEVFTCQAVLFADQHRGYVVLMNQQHLLDGAIASRQLEAGMLDLLLARQPDAGGISVRLVGAVILVVFLVALATTFRSLAGLRGWRNQVKTLTAGQIVSRIVPHLLIPALIAFVLYRYLGTLLLGEPRAWNFRCVGAYFMPDIALLMLLAIVPDLLQGVYMAATAIVDRIVRRSVRS